ncbi:uncharacterized protein [Rutidosis leptorrhynchoides]|uniref:uncharacterized protein n=1 Tax=Rutidosis leptorrhynchoides TaxID=125765 RepID=UPI003A99C40F
MKKGKAKVKWDDLCIPKDKGGLGIKRMKYWNVALMATHVWRILNNKESLWLLMREKLKTQDRIKEWEISNQTLLCPLCNLCADSQSHLFFACAYSHDVWKKAKQLINIDVQGNDWLQISNFLASGPINNSNFIVAKLMFAGSVYFIWQERNSRLFKGRKRTVDRLFEDIYATVRLKLLSVRFKESSQTKLLKIAWKLN